MFDTDGKRYIDMAGGAVVVAIGHGDGTVADAAAAQMRKVSYAHGTQFTSRPLEDYAARVSARLPLDQARIYPVSGGSEAVESALKLARTYHLARGHDTRHRVIARHGSYHGNSLGALDASGRPVLREPYLPWLGRAAHVAPPYEYRCSLPGHPDGCGRAHAALLDETIEALGPETVSCFIAEPISGAGLAAAVPSDDYWPAIAEVCRRHGVLLVADEVMTGFGRTGRWFACEHWSLKPDILVAAKGASSGYWPLGFAACSRNVYDAVAGSGFVHGFTHSHSVSGAVVGLAVLDRLESLDLVEASRSKGECLRDRLVNALGDHPNVGDVRGRGLQVGIELVRDRATKAPFSRSDKITERIVATAKEAGVLLYPATGIADGTNGDALLLGPPFVIADGEIVEAVDRVAGAITSVMAGTSR